MFGFESARLALNLDTIFSIITQKCNSQLGKESVKSLSPISHKPNLIKQLDLLKAISNIIEKDGRLPLNAFADIRVLLNKIEPENSFLEVKECLEIQNILEITENILSFFKEQEFVEASLTELVRGLSGQQQLLSQLQYTIEPSGEIFDNASGELKSIRKKLKNLREEVNKKLERISQKNAEHLQEDFITLRDGRLVLPVREFSVSKISGIVHGQSATGATKYVEPMAVVEVNNEIQVLLNEEKKEIVKILKRLSALIRESAEQLGLNQNVLIQLDTLQARSLYGISIEANIPDIIDDHYWSIQKAFHPILLDRIKDETVPLSVELGDSINMLIISGPNAGGKTVAMKTVGLLQLMFQCAIPIPVAAGSKFPICEQVFVQIGDKQSIENDLSTFSSHITGLNHILKNVKTKALVLIDEIGIGTEPSGGAALAISILEVLNRDGILTLVSTHQNQLKLFASQTAGIENGAMQFDIKELRPMFILETGVPGSSFTFDICRRFGLNDELIKRARGLEGNDNQEIDKLLNDISEKSLFYQQAVRELSVKQSKLDGLVSLYEKNSEELKLQRKKLEKEAKQQAKEIIDTANRKIENVIREIKESSAEKTTVKKLRSDLNDYRQSLNIKDKQKAPVELNIADIKLGQKIRSLTYNITGHVTKIFKNKNAVEIEREGLKLTINLSELELLSEDGLLHKQKPDENITHIASNISHEVDIRGCEVDEGLEQVDAYLDSAINSDWQEVTIIHGKGSGVLRAAVQLYLKKHKTIKEFRTGRYGEGDAGVTIVVLK